jgi:hypothetical protein
LALRVVKCIRQLGKDDKADTSIEIRDLAVLLSYVCWRSEADAFGESRKVAWRSARIFTPIVHFAAMTVALLAGCIAVRAKT